MRTCPYPYANASAYPQATGTYTYSTTSADPNQAGTNTYTYPATAQVR